MRPQLPLLVVLAIVYLAGSAGTYLAAGLGSYPRQEWLVEGLASAVFLIPVFNLLHAPGPIGPAIRFLGGTMLVHALWDAAHWPGRAWIDTPIEPLVPRLCWIGDVALGVFLIAIDASRRDSRA
jgi:hypothetical protein